MNAIDSPTRTAPLVANPFPGWPLQTVAPMDEASLASLESYGILDAPPEAAFDDITRMAMMVCRTPVAVINLIGAERQWFKSGAGLDLGDLPFLSSIFAHTTQGSDILVVPNLATDPRFADHALVTHSPAMRFYAGAPLRTAEGHTLGSVSVLDTGERHLTGEQTEALRSLARQVMVLVELRRTLTAADALLVESHRLNTALQRAEALRSETLGMVAHELNSPLAVLLGTAEGLRSGLIHETADRADAFVQMTTSARRLSKVVGNMLALAPPEGECVGVGMEPFLVQHSFDAAIAEHRHLHPGSEIQLRVADDLPIACGDPGYFDQIITNLLSNAAKYGTPDKPITLTANPCEEGILVCVSNEGPVLGPENIERLFAPFYREAKHSPLAQGVGLGLAVCRRLTDAQGGRIWATARPEGGLEVNFTLPIVTDES